MSHELISSTNTQRTDMNSKNQTKKRYFVLFLVDGGVLNKQKYLILLSISHQVIK